MNPSPQIPCKRLPTFLGTTKIRRYLHHPESNRLVPLKLCGGGSYLVRQDPTTVTSIFNGGKEEMDILANPSIECVSIFAEVLCQWIGDHVGIWKPTITQY